MYIFGSTCWGHSTGVVETNVRTFASNWTGTGSIENSGDSERLAMTINQYMESELVETGVATVELDQNHYVPTGTTLLRYRTGATPAACLAATWNDYNNTPFVSSGYVQVRVEYWP